MPKNPKQALGTRLFRNYKEESLNEALQAIRNKTLSIQAASSTYGIPKNILHLKSQEKHFNAVERAPVFINKEEQLLLGHIVAVANYGFPVDVFELRCIVKSYLDHCGRKQLRFKNNLPGNDWAEGFMNRYKAVLTLRTAKKHPVL